jgi:hypothetical protein
MSSFAVFKTKQKSIFPGLADRRPSQKGGQAAGAEVGFWVLGSAG